MNDFSFWVCWQQSGNGLRHTRRPSSSDNHEQNEQLDYYSYFGGWLKGKTNPDYGNCDENFIHNINCVNAAWLFIICVLLHHYTVFFVHRGIRRIRRKNTHAYRFLMVNTILFSSPVFIFFFILLSFEIKPRWNNTIPISRCSYLHYIHIIIHIRANEK